MTVGISCVCRRMLAIERCGDFGRCVAWIDLVSGLYEVGLKPREFVFTSGDQIAQRDFDHLLVSEHPLVGLGADRVVAGRMRRGSRPSAISRMIP